MDQPTSFDDLVLRAYRGPADHPAMTRVSAAVRAFNGDRELGTVADMDNHYAHIDHADLARDCALIELDGRVVAYGRTSWEQLTNGERQVAGLLFIEPGARGGGAEELILGHALARASELLPEIGRERTTRMIVYVTGRHPELRLAVENVRFRRVRRSAQLVRPTLDDIPDLPVPPPFEVRPIDPGDRAMHRRVYDADARAFADSHGQQAPSDAGFEQFIGWPSFNPRLWRVAFDGDRIAGQILSYVEDKEPGQPIVGWTEAISVQPEYRRRGLARALLAESLRAVRDAGATVGALGVDTQNPNEALTLYEGLGFRIVSETFEYELGPFAPGERPAIPAGIGQ
jgi:mycothiol synthase